MRRVLNVWSRRLHRWGAIATLLPLGLVVGTGLLLQVKKHWSWVQPPTLRGAVPGAVPAMSLDEVVRAAGGVAEAELDGWAGVARIDVQPGRGIAKVQSANGWEAQVDLATGAVLQAAYRRSDLIESLHDGSFFGDAAKLWVFLPTGVVVGALWLTGVWLWVMPHVARRVRAGREAQSRRS